MLSRFKTGAKRTQASGARPLTKPKRNHAAFKKAGQTDLLF